MIDEEQNALVTDAINTLTEKLSIVLLKEFLELPDDVQINLVLIKTVQLLLANVLCQVATNNDELKKIVADQGVEMKELTFSCALTGFPEKFGIIKH